MRKFTAMLVIGIVLVGGAAWSAPFVDSLIVASKAFPVLGTVGFIVVALHNDTAISGFQTPFVITSQTGGAFGTVDSVTGGLIAQVPTSSLTKNLVRVRNGSPDSIFILWVDFSGLNPIPAGTRRNLFLIWVTNNSFVGTYSLDSNRLSASNTL